MTTPGINPGLWTRRDRNVAVVLAVLVLAVFAPVLGHDFVSWDDTTYVSGNPAVTSGTLSGLVQIWRGVDPTAYMPLAYTVWWGVALVARVDDGTGHATLNPYLFHAPNWLTHAAVAVLTYALLRRLRFGPGPAGIGAAAAALHPLAVESVAWTLGLRDLLAAAFSLASVRTYAGVRRRSAAGLMALAVLAKPTAVVAWPLAVVVAWYADTGGDAGGNETAILRLRRHALASWPLAIVALAGVPLAGLHAQQIHADLSVVWQRPFVAADAVAFYLAKVAWPVPLAFDYARTPAAAFASGAAWWTWTVPAVIGLAVLRARSRAARLAAAFFVLPLLPVLGFVPFAFQSLSTVADHYAYLSLAGLAVAVAAICRRWPGSVPWLAVVLVAWAGLTVRQERAWTDDATFFPFMAAANPHSGPAWDGVARTRLAAGDVAGADAAATRGIGVAPDYAFLRLTAVRIKSLRHDPAGRAEQLDQLERIYRGQANFDPAVFALARAALER